MRTVSALALVALLVGCSSTRTVAPGSSASAEVNRELAGRTAEVRLTDGRVVQAQSLTLGPDSTSWFEPGRAEMVQVATAEVVSVSRVSRGKGFRQGALTAGLVAGVTLWLSVMSSGDWEGFEATKPTISLAVGVLSGAMAAPLGGGVGYLLGAHDHYEVQPAGVLPAPAEAPGGDR